MWRWVCFGGLQRLQRLLLALLLAAGLAPAAHAQRVALLVGNAGYSSAPLRNPPNDVREMEAALTAVGFKVSKVLNANQSQLKRAVRDFGNSARGAEMALLYYSGHGTQVRGENYLIPVGANIEKESDYEIEAVSANAVLEQLREAQPRAAVVVLDACRDNPHMASTKSLTKGLARMDAPTGTMIAFATAPNDVAQDNGLYARILAINLQRPGLELLDVFRDTTTEVRRQSGGAQVPRVSEVSIDQRIYLAGLGGAAQGSMNQSSDAISTTGSTSTRIVGRHPLTTGPFPPTGSSQQGSEPRLATVTIDGQTFTVPPDERRAFEYAMTQLQQTNFASAATGFQAFLKQFPASGYTATTLYWLGLAQYADRSYKEAIDTHRRLVTEFPKHSKSADALLAISNSQIEIKDLKGVLQTLEQLSQSYPESEAAAEGRKRILYLSSRK